MIRGLLPAALAGLLLCQVTGRAATNATADAAGKLHVRAYRFTGNTVFTSAQLSAVLANFTGRELGATELEEARQTVTMHYVRAGYVNSGCLIEAQKVEDGVIELRVVEGRLTGLNITGTRWLRTGYIKPRIWRAAGEPLNLQSLQEGMLQLRELPFIKDIKAELQPGEERGQGVLDVRVEESRMPRLTFLANNHRPPSVGAEGLDGLLTVPNPSGWGDALELQLGLLQRDSDSVRFPGGDNLGVRYELPVSARDTTLQWRFDRRNFGVIEEPFAVLNIDTIAEYFSVQLRHPFKKTLTEELAFSLIADLRESRTFLSGVPFTLAPGAVNGETRVSVLRWAADYLKRGRTQVVAARLTLSLGTDWLGATDDGTDRDGQFVSVSGQGQYLRELNDRGCKLLLGGGFQWASSPLLSLEQFSLGGAATLRGYRENSVVRDAGVRGSVEFRLPVIGGGPQRDVLQLAPFFDCGAAWSLDSPAANAIFLPAAGIGLIWTPSDRFSSRVFWGHAFDNPSANGNDLQDHGIHFSLSYRAF